MVKGDFKDRVGETYITNQGYKVKIIKSSGVFDCTIEFEDGYVVYGLEYHNIKKGAVDYPFHLSVCGVGYIGVGRFSVKSHKTAHSHWSSMLKRCHSKKELKNNLTYNNVNVCEEWKCFQNFAEWFESNYKEKFELDKDILIKNNKVYSPKTCCFVPQEINKLFLKRQNRRGMYPIGVFKDGLRYRASISGKRFNTVEETFQSYKTAKELRIKEIADKWKSHIAPEVHQAMYNWVIEITD